MQARNLLALSAVTLVAVVMAVLSLLFSPRYDLHEKTGKIMFPGLFEKINQVATVTIENNEELLTFNRDKKGWVLKELKNYPALGERVRGVIIGIANLELLEPKTKKQERFAEIQVNMPDEEDSKSELVTIIGKDGELMARLIVGMKKASITGEDDGVFVREPDSIQSWLAKGKINTNGGAFFWIEHQIVNVRPEEIKRIEIRYADGNRLTLSRQSPEEDIALETSIEHALFRNKDKKRRIDELMNVLTELKFKAVRHEKKGEFPEKDVDDLTEEEFLEHDFSKKPIPKIVFYTFNGLVVRVDRIFTNKADWFRFQVKPDKVVDTDVVEKANYLAKRHKRWLYKLTNFPRHTFLDHLSYSGRFGEEEKHREEEAEDNADEKESSEKQETPSDKQKAYSEKTETVKEKQPEKISVEKEKK